jgi:YidC/Oxa1 family membrane protein insertase
MSMERRTLLATVLALLVLVLWGYFTGPTRQPAPEEPPAPVGEEALPAVPGEEPAEAVVPSPDTGPGEAGELSPSAELTDRLSGETPSAPVTDVINANPREIVLENDLYRIRIHELGAQVRVWELRGFGQIDPKGRPVLDGQGRPVLVDLVSPAADNLWERGRAEGGGPQAYPGYPLAILLGDQERSRALNLAGFVCEGPLSGSDGQGAATLAVDCRYRSAAEGIEVHKRLTLTQGSYLAELEVEVRDLAGRGLPEARILWGPGMGRPTEAQSKNRYYFSGRVVAAATQGKAERFDRNRIGESLEIPSGGGLAWAGMEEQYFAAVFLPSAGQEGVPRLPLRSGPATVLRFEETTLDEEGKEELQPRLALTLPIEEGAGAGYRLFVGPKESKVLEAVDRETGSGLGRMVDWGFFSFIAVPLYRFLVWLYGLVGNFGVAIIIVTVIIKILFFPLTQRAMVNMRKTQEKMSGLQPKMKAIRERYKKKKDPDARKKMNQEIMALYQKEGVNPMGGLAGCFPLLLQLPILYAMYRVLSQALELRGAPFFGWVQDLSLADPLMITPIVMGATMLAQQLMAMTKAKDPQQRQQQRMMLFMPIMFTFFFINMPSGLVLYWLVNNVLGIGQQWLINRQAARLLAQG